jgi:hypothetical protein
MKYFSRNVWIKDVITECRSIVTITSRAHGINGRCTRTPHLYRVWVFTTGERPRECVVGGSYVYVHLSLTHSPRPPSHSYHHLLNTVVDGARFSEWRTKRGRGKREEARRTVSCYDGLSGDAWSFHIWPFLYITSQSNHILRITEFLDFVHRPVI